MSRFAKFAWFVVVLNLAVIAWGAVVRATGSGAGCGSHWPDCDGSIVPLSGSSETLIEFVHRATSGLALVAVGVLVVGAFRRFAPGHGVRRAAVAAGVLMIVEALLGAGLVIFEQVADNEETSRALWISGHFVNTLLLVGALTLAAWWATDDRPRADAGPVTGSVRGLVYGGVAAMLLVGMSGAVAALGDTLFPVSSFGEGLERELSSTAHLFERLRLAHPVIAIVAGLFVAGSTRLLAADDVTQRLSSLVVAGVLIQFGIGVVNVALAAPVGMQIVHLLAADLTWIAFVLFGAERLQLEPEPVPGRPAEVPA